MLEMGTWNSREFWETPQEEGKWMQPAEAHVLNPWDSRSLPADPLPA